jgi:hypothetical protein
VRRVAPLASARADFAAPPWRDLAPAPLVPSHGRAPGPDFQPTALRVCHDGERLHVGFDCADRDVWGSFTGRNEPIYDEEVVEAFLAPAEDPRRYFELESNPRGAYFEARVESPGGVRATMRVDRDWRCAGWSRDVRVDGDLERRDARHRGWRVAWSIPFASLDAAPPAPGTRWRANFHRIDRWGDGQFSAWSPTLADPPDFHLPTRFGWLLF